MLRKESELLYLFAAAVSAFWMRCLRGALRQQVRARFFTQKLGVGFISGAPYL